MKKIFMKIGWFLLWQYWELIFHINKRLDKDIWHPKRMSDEYKGRFKYR